MSTSSGEKLDNFMRAILSDAESESSLIIDELRRKREADKSKTEDEILNETFRHIKAQVGMIKTEAGRRVSRKALENTRAIYAHREKIMNGVLNQVLARLDEFVKDPEYIEHLKRLAQKAGETLGEGPVVFYLTDRDMELSVHIRKSVGAGCEFKAGGFSLGGIVAECPERRLRIDESFDSSFENVKSNFAEILGFGLHSD